MFRSFLKKELLQFLRRPQELLILLFMPFVLITILGFALGNLMNGEEQTIQITVAIVEHSSEEEEIAQFTKTLVENDVPEEMIETIAAQVKELAPITMLKERIFKDPSMQSFATLEQIKPSQFEAVKKEGKHSAILEVPKNFTSSTLESIFLGSSEKSELILYMNEGKELTADIIKGIVSDFQEQYSLFARMGQQQLLSNFDLVDQEPVNLIVRTIDKKVPVGAMEYYTIGMSVMFILFTASSIGGLAYSEKKNQLFNRMLLSNISGWTYMASIFATTLIVTFIQLSILFGEQHSFMTFVFRIFQPFSLSHSSSVQQLAELRHC